VGVWGGEIHLGKRKRKRCALDYTAKAKDEKILHDYTAAINKLLEIWTCWVYGVEGGMLFPPLQTQTQTLRAVRAAGGTKKKRKNPA